MGLDNISLNIFIFDVYSDIFSRILVIKYSTLSNIGNINVIIDNGNKIVPIWQKRLLGKNMKKQIGVGFIKVGSTKLSNEVYYKAMEDASTKFADAIIADAEAGTLFVK